MPEFRYTNDPLYLSPANRDVLELIAAGCTNRAIATRLGLKPDTVRRRIFTMMARTRAPNRTALVVIGLKVAWIDLEDIQVEYEVEGI